MNESEKDKRVFELADQFLRDWQIGEMRVQQVLDTYASPRPRRTNLTEIYEQLLESAQNAERKPKVIGKPIGGISQLKEILFDFQPKEIASKYGSDSHRLLQEIIGSFPMLRNINTEKRGLWPQYCRTILSGATFMSQFLSANEFYSNADQFDQNEMTRASLALLLDQEIDGFGFALACDFLKELGYEQFAKPDSQIRRIFEELKLCNANSSDYRLFRAVIRVSNNAQVTPYKADKWFWLIGSGNFYNNKEIGKDGLVKGRAKEFITRAQEELYT